LDEEIEEEIDNEEHLPVEDVEFEDVTGEEPTILNPTEEEIIEGDVYGMMQNEQREAAKNRIKQDQQAGIWPQGMSALKIQNLIDQGYFSWDTVPPLERLKSTKKSRISPMGANQA
jgi:hypothetical protein